MKSNLYFVLFLISILTSCSYDLDDKLKFEDSINTQDIILVDSDLFNHIKEIAKTEDNPNNSIACIDFQYPLTLFVFDEDLVYQSTEQLTSDQNFSEFLESLDLSYSISIAFPISSVLNSGEEFIINTKEELKDAIDNCLEEELIIECQNQLDTCLWKIGYSYGVDNPYLAGIFQESNGFATLNVRDSLFVGSWTPFVIENELHINISLNDTTAVGDFFNKDWKAEYIDENSIRLHFEDQILTLNQRCDPDFNVCGNFNFETCAMAEDPDLSEFILDDYSSCIFDTLELSDEFEIHYFESAEDAEMSNNPIVSNVVYSNVENNQPIYVKIEDLENGIQYYVVITLSVIDC